ncbi:MAG: phosphoribosylglycinamide formyltransferase [Desulfovibrionaceae bacterium]|nr:phosphoribosylglycinamide formyltransferase [Desulfovibrionaceae bacterium]
MPLKLAILASGTGTNAQAIIDKSRAGLLDVEICLIASNRPKAMVLERAKQANIPHICVDHTLFASREEFDLAMLDAIQKSNAQAIALAGYMRILSATFLHGFQGPVLNLHPALLPSFPGTHGGADALAYGVKISGVTVHFVDEKMDHGPVIIQAAVPVKDADQEDDLMNRIHKLEHRIYPQALQWLAHDRLKIKERRVLLSPGSAKTITPSGEFFIYPPLEEGF